MEHNKKQPVDSIKSLIDLTQASFAIAWKAVLLLGGLIVVAYCYLESIVPEGLSLSDAFFLASAAFSLTCIALIGVGFCAFATVWAIKFLVIGINFRLKRRGQLPTHSLHSAFDNGSTVFMSFLVALPLAYLLIFVRDQAPDTRMHATLIFFTAVGAIAAILLLIVPATTRERNVRLSLSFLAMTVFAALVVTRPAILNLAMVNLGVRSAPGQIVLFSDAEHTQLAAIASANDVKVQFCKLSDTDKWGTRNARAVWHGVGGSSYVRLFDENDASRNVLVRANRADVEVLRAERTRFNCPSGSTSAPVDKSS
jgi:hypothetical protein